MKPTVVFLAGVAIVIAGVVTFLLEPCADRGFLQALLGQPDVTWAAFASLVLLSAGASALGSDRQLYVFCGDAGLAVLLLEAACVAWILLSNVVTGVALEGSGLPAGDPTGRRAASQG